MVSPTGVKLRDNGLMRLRIITRALHERVSRDKICHHRTDCSTEVTRACIQEEHPSPYGGLTTRTCDVSRRQDTAGPNLQIVKGRTLVPSVCRGGFVFEVSTPIEFDWMESFRQGQT